MSAIPFQTAKIVELHLLEPVFFASRELSDTYYTEGAIGNYALTYAFGFANSPYRLQGKQTGRPTYKEDFASIKNTCYILPASPKDGRVTYRFERFNALSDSYWYQMTNNRVATSREDLPLQRLQGKGKKIKTFRASNFPQVGRLRMIERGNKFQTLVFGDCQLANYIRVGKFMSKVRVNIIDELPVTALPEGEYQTQYYLNSADLPSNLEASLQSLAKKGVKITRIDGENKNSENQNSQLLASQTAVNLELRPKPDRRDDLLQAIANQIVERIQKKPEQNGAVILDSKDNINRLADLLKHKGFEDKFGRITGSTPQLDRKLAAQKQIILATSTVDVGFNFERNIQTKRQNLDWLIFSARDRAAFWQRLGRVGRVLGKTQTDIPSDAIAYLPDTAWEQGLSSSGVFSLNTIGEREALKKTLEKISCLDKPFLHAYWRSEAFLEIARPLLELENKFKGLAGSEYIPQLFNTLKDCLGGKRTWDDYRWRMKVFLGAENIAKTAVKDLKKGWKFLPGGQAFVKTFIKANFPDDWEEFQAGNITLADYEEIFSERDEAVNELKEFAQMWKASYSPLFKFRDSLFENLPIADPHGFLLDESEQTILDPIHLLRYYEFQKKEELIELTARAENSKIKLK